MKIATCPECGGGELYTPEKGPTLFRELPIARFNVVVCGDCGLTRMFARRIDVQALKAGPWVRVAEPVAPLGLDQT
jgi:predicted nucleic-acid-binding Zn-ribbon protein